MENKDTTNSLTTLPRHVTVIGAAGGLGNAILEACRENGVGFTAVVRSRPERISNVPEGSRVVVVSSLADEASLSASFNGADAVLTAIGVTATSFDSNALLSRNMASVERAMLTSGVNRIVLMNTLLSPSPGEPASLLMRLFSWIPGKVGRGARELRAVVDALGSKEFSRLRWTLVRGGVNSGGFDETPVASLDWRKGVNSWTPVSYRAMGLWMLQEAVTEEFINAAPFVSRKRT